MNRIALPVLLLLVAADPLPAQCRLVYEHDSEVLAIAGTMSGAAAFAREGRLLAIPDGGRFRFDDNGSYAALDSEVSVVYQVNRRAGGSRENYRERWLVTCEVEVGSTVDVAQLYAVQAWQTGETLRHVKVLPVQPVRAGAGGKVILADRFEIAEEEGAGCLRVHVFRGAEELRTRPLPKSGRPDPQRVFAALWRSSPPDAAALADAAGKLRAEDVQAIVRTGREDFFAALVTARAPLREKDGQKRTCLHAAAETGRADLVAPILRAGVEGNSADENGYTALMRAGALGHADTVPALLAGRAEVHRQSGERQTALTLAALNGHTEIAQDLLDAGAKWPRGRDLSELLADAIRESRGEIAAQLIAAGADANYKSDDKPLLVLAAIHAGWPEANLLLSAGAAVDGRDKLGRTALMIAAVRDRWDSVNGLLSAGADINAVDKAGRSALLYALERNCTRVLPELFERHPSTAPVAKLGEPALREAIARGDAPTARQLHAAGARLQRTKSEKFDDDRMLALAVALGLDDVVIGALDHGWSPDTRLFEGWSLAAVAERYGQQKILDALQQRQHGDPPRLRPDVPRGTAKTDPLLPSARPAPVYPAKLQATGITGEATVEVLVTPEGNAVLPRLVRADRPEFGEAALQAAAWWRFSPSKLKPPVWRKAEVPFGFADPQMGNLQLHNLAALDQLPSPLRQPAPVLPAGYPADRIAAAFVRFIVDESGGVYAPRVDAITDESLRESVLEAVRRWEFRPGYKGDRPVAARYSLYVMFPGAEDFAAAGDSAALFPVGKKSSLPQILNASLPEFPRNRLADTRTHLTVIECVVDERGRTGEAKVVAGSDPDFDGPLLKAVADWRFKPPRQDGKAVGLRLRRPVMFIPAGAPVREL
jgi:TonB family protein